MAFPEPQPRKQELPRKLLRSLDCKQGAVRAVRFNVDGNYCLTCGSDKSLKLWSPMRGTLLKTYSGHGYEVLDADGSCDNSHLTSCGSDKTVILWDVATGQVIRKLRGHAGKVNCVRFNEEATVILSGSIDTSVRCWDTRSRQRDPIQILDEAKDGVSSLRVSEHEILTGSVDGRVRRYDLRMGQLHSDFVDSPVTCVCFSKDGQCTLSSSLDSTLRLLDKDTGELLGEYKGHKNSRYKLECCLTEKDTHVVSCSEDGSVYYWDLVQGSLSLSVSVGKGVVQSLSFHPTEPRLLTASEGSIQLWGEESLVMEEEEGEGPA
ncbi:WD repeat domain-containing protein 83-like [Acipenser oxyrinchus oxyrinchus]|uniref:WD repeat domain-containing protein 83 n=1 Tax=Acipenser oxyrinchus oxyrinchus TaxID=40147 RepID=A0AAD8CLF2_ACIOX|nr:WD repeat domain-containing protein 83-like [Acipenser oxyrinchus oxyrinchus]